MRIHVQLPFVSTISSILLEKALLYCCSISTYIPSVLRAIRRKASITTFSHEVQTNGLTLVSYITQDLHENRSSGSVRISNQIH